MSIIGFSVLAIMTLWQHVEILFFVLFLLVMLYTVIDKNLTRFYGFVMSSFIGSLAEILCVNLGIWSYTLPQLSGIPIWMFPGWGFGYLSTITLYLVFENKIK